MEIEKKLPIMEIEPKSPGDMEQGIGDVDKFYANPRGHGELEVAYIRDRIPILRKLRALEAWLDSKFGVEKTGAERVPEDQRRPPNILNVCFDLKP